ncbi:uncharacterized protein LOC144807907 [Lissotriton helveticus]
MVQPSNCRRISLRRRSIQDGSRGEAESIPQRAVSYCSSSSCNHGSCSDGKCVCDPGYTGSTCNRAASSGADAGLIIGLTAGLPAVGSIIFSFVICCCKKGCWHCITSCTYFNKDRRMILNNVRIQYNAENFTPQRVVQGGGDAPSAISADSSASVSAAPSGVCQATREYEDIAVISSGSD